MKKRLPILILLTLLGLLAACANTTPPTSRSTQVDAEEVPPLPALDTAQIALGETVYVQNCASCHGENLEGEAGWKIQNE